MGVKFPDSSVGRMTQRFLRASAGLLAMALAACGGGDREGGAASGNAPSVITADGSSTVFPITEAVAEEFQRENRGVRVTVGLSGTGGGFQKFCRGETDLSNASRPIKPTEIEACAKGGIDYIELPIAYDGIAVVVHPNNDWATSMTRSRRGAAARLPDRPAPSARPTALARVSKITIPARAVRP